jgi:hypothetical protein
MLPWIALTLTAVNLVVGAWLLLSYHHGLYPVLHLAVDLKSAPDGLIVVQLQVKNASKTVAVIDESQPPRVVIAEEDASKVSPGGYFSEFVAFGDRKDRNPTFIKDTRDVLETTETIEPGELISVEFPYRLKNKGSGIHCGFQVKAKLGKAAKIANRLGSRIHRGNSKVPHAAQFTTVAYLVTSAVQEQGQPKLPLAG